MFVLNPAIEFIKSAMIHGFLSNDNFVMVDERVKFYSMTSPPDSHN